MNSFDFEFFQAQQFWTQKYQISYDIKAKKAENLHITTTFFPFMH